MRFRDYFLVGMGLGLIYSALRYPAALGCVLVVPLIIAIILIIVFWHWALVIGIGVVLGLSLRHAYHRRSADA